jgi:hypothetical protein
MQSEAYKEFLLWKSKLGDVAKSDVTIIKSAKPEEPAIEMCPFKNPSAPVK